MRVHSAASSRPDDSSRMPVDIRRFPWTRPLAADSAYHFTPLAPFLAGDPADPSAWTAAIARAQAHPRDREEVAALLAAQQHARHAPEPARAAAARLADSTTVAVLTGQQAGLFGGPLYTLLKALTALKIAAEVTRADGTPAVAVFWIDAEDHDWDEVRACRIFDERLDVVTAALPERSGPETPVGPTMLAEADLTAALGALDAGLPPTEFHADLIARLRAAYVPGVSLAYAFGRWLEAILGDRGLVVFDASDPAAKPLVADLFARELEAPGETARLATTAGAELAACGYHAQVEPVPGSAALFRFGPDGARHALRLDDGRFATGDALVEPATLANEARTNPAAFSPNVLLRPIVQDTLFPTICYVAGPSELAYLAQLRAAYAALGVPMPLVVPRASATVADAAALRFLAKYDVSLEALQPRDEAALNMLLQAQIPPEVEATFATASDRIAEALAAIGAGVATVDPTLKGATDSTLGRMQHDLQTLHNKMIAAAKRRDDTLRRQFIRTRALVFPAGEPQERAIGFVWFLNQYGPALVDRLDAALPLDLGTHWIVTV